MHTTTTASAPAPAHSARLSVTAACTRVAPLWPLQSFVAVNPFLGLQHLEFSAAARLLEQNAHGRVLMDPAYYRRQLHDGHITPASIYSALARLGWPGTPSDPTQWLDHLLAGPGHSARLLTVADRLDRTHSTRWASFVVDEISKWCSSYFDLGQSRWAMPWRGLPLFAAWQQAAAHDANPELSGIPSFRPFVRSLPESSLETIELLLETLNVPSSLEADFLHRQLMSVSGWSAYAAGQDWTSPHRPTVQDLLAIRLAYDAALLPLLPHWRVETVPHSEGFTEACLLAQLALEHSLSSRIAAGMRAARPPAPARKALQAVFCIDVRSEAYRRALEAQSDDIQTHGFAGFFGMPLQLGADALCPVLLQPRYHLEQPQPAPSTNLAGLWKSLKTSTVACFPAVELGGAAFAAGLLHEFLRQPSPHSPSPFSFDIPLAERADLAAAALRYMSLQPALLAPLVLLCGHAARTENNPHAASLDCGACGGHSGEHNARFAAALLNDPEVRAELHLRGLAIPPDTTFLAALHETTTDTVTLFDDAGLEPSTRALLHSWLAQASAVARARRAPTSHNPARLLRRRAADWSEVRPEWGLAGNAAFIAAPRWRTRALSLEGRAFLHDYDPTLDPDGSALTLILTAPVVVASWINLQYYASTVDNHLYGSGNKALHNVVGRLGVWEGNAGDLRTGLPLQSLHDGQRWVHEPLRLQVLIEAPRHRISAILRRHESIRQLADGGWLQLVALGDDGAFLYQGCLAWTPMNHPFPSAPNSSPETQNGDLL